jgi:agmatine deiminase
MVGLPKKLGYRMPAEWERHEATWIAWPHEPRDWPGKFSAIPWVYAEIVRHLARGERVRILVNDKQIRAKAERLLKKAGVPNEPLEFFEIPTDRCWTRDSGPIFVCRDQDNRREVALTRWRFNGWSKYPNWHNDCRVPESIGKALAFPMFEARRSDGESPVVLEGGSIDVNGRGSLITTEQCLLSDVQERNPGLERADYERLFADYLDVSKVIWLGRGIAGDDTHGHVDDLARFVGPETVVAVEEHDPADENYRPLQENLERLRGATNEAGQRLQVVALPMPHRLTFAGQRLPASYANFYIANDAVLVPTFNDARDREALGALAEVFPGREVVGIHAVDLVWGFGTLHCLTQQQPMQPLAPGWRRLRA